MKFSINPGCFGDVVTSRRDTSDDPMRLFCPSVPHTDAFDWLSYIGVIGDEFTVTICHCLLSIVPLAEFCINQIEHRLVANLFPIFLEHLDSQWDHSTPPRRRLVTRADGWSRQHGVALVDYSA